LIELNKLPMFIRWKSVADGCNQPNQHTQIIKNKLLKKLAFIKNTFYICLYNFKYEQFR